MSYARLLRTLIITLAAAVTLPLLGAGPDGVAESREAARAAKALEHRSTQLATPAPTSDTTSAHALPSALDNKAVQNALASAGNTQVVRVAAAASAPGSFLGMGMSPPERPSFTAEPPAFVLFVAGLLAVLFISTRRRKDR